jgi:hypothetical protein
MRLLLAPALLLLAASACSRSTAGDPCKTAPHFPALEVGQATTPTEIDIDVPLAARGEPASARAAFWRSVSVDRGERAPDGTPWKNDAEYLAGLSVTLDKEPVIHLGLQRFSPRTRQEIRDRLLTLHLTFDAREAAPGCPATTGKTYVDVELALFSSATVPLGVKDFRWGERPTPAKAR